MGKQQTRGTLRSLQSRFKELIKDTKHQRMNAIQLLTVEMVELGILVDRKEKLVAVVDRMRVSLNYLGAHYSYIITLLQKTHGR